MPMATRSPLKEITTAVQILDLLNTSGAISYMNDRIYADFQRCGVPCQDAPSCANRVQILHTCTRQIRRAERPTSRSIH